MPITSFEKEPLWQLILRFLVITVEQRQLSRHDPTSYNYCILNIIPTIIFITTTYYQILNKANRPNLENEYHKGDSLSENYMYYNHYKYYPQLDIVHHLTHPVVHTHRYTIILCYMTQAKCAMTMHIFFTTHGIHTDIYNKLAATSNLPILRSNLVVGIPLSFIVVEYHIKD